MTQTGEVGLQTGPEDNVDAIDEVAVGNFFDRRSEAGLLSRHPGSCGS
jgi:hypothetical protein